MTINLLIFRHSFVVGLLAGAISEADHSRQLRRAVIASTVGTTIESYDFLLYSVVTGLVFGNAHVCRAA
jgi:hypothetical protein